jgi:hypothetical protein
VARIIVLIISQEQLPLLVQGKNGSLFKASDSLAGSA